MKKKLISLMLAAAMVLSPLSVCANTPDTTQKSPRKPDIFKDIFGGTDELDPEEEAKNLPYPDGTVLSDIREPLFANETGSRIFGEDNTLSTVLSWKSKAAPTLPGDTVNISGKSFTLASKMKILASYEGDFDGTGRKNELALLVAAKKTDGKSLLLLCTAKADFSAPLVPIAVLYDGSESKADFYANTAEFVNCTTLACGDFNGDGYDEIITISPINGYAAQSSGDKYGFDLYNASFVWYLEDTDNRTWCQTPYLLVNGGVLSENAHLGAPGVTASVAVADINGDGYDDIVSAITANNAQYNANYSDNKFAVYYTGGAAELRDMYTNRKLLLNYVDGETKKALRLSATSGDAAAFDVVISDVDGSGKPTVFLSLKETLNHYVGFNGDKMLTPRFYILAFDYTDSGNFVSSVVYKGGIYHHGYIGDTERVYKASPIDNAPVQIGILGNDFGLSAGKSGYVSSGTIIADQKYLSFVRYPDGNTYRYDVKDNGAFTGSFGSDVSETDFGYAGKDCVFFNNGINVNEIRTANVSFDGNTYTDAALVRAYTQNGYRLYYLTASGNGYITNPSAALLAGDNRYALTAMPDTDHDSIYLKYNKHAFFWADPVIIAALASPPYFDSLPNDMYANSQTTYGRSTTTASGKTESFSVAAGAYISTEIKAGTLGTAGVFESENEALRSKSQEKENTTEVTFSQSFSATGGEDTVVLSTVAYDAYAYTAYYPGAGGALQESPYIVYVPRKGSDSVKIASLNYEDYLEFIPYADGVLPDLKDVFTHTPGHPETYPHTAPSDANVLSGSIITHPRLATFPSNTGSQTLTIDITEETTQTTSAGWSVSAKLGGGVETEAEGIFGLADMGTKVTVGSVTEKEYEAGKITTTAVGTSFEGTVFGQGDGMNVSGSGEQKADFNWRLLHYVYQSTDGSEQRFPVITYITSGVTQPQGVIPTSVKVTPTSKTLEQVGPKTVNHVNKASFTVTAAGITREAYTALEGAPLGMELDAHGNIGTSAPFSFDIVINGNVKPGEYPVVLNVGGVRSDPFTVKVTEYVTPVWIEADKTELDFGNMRFNYAKGTPAAETQFVTIKSLHTELQSDFTAELNENSDFEITSPLSSSTLYAKDLANSAATVGIAPKKGLSVGTHTGTLTVTNGITAAYVTLVYTVTNPTLPGAPGFQNAQTYTPNPIRILVDAPEDDGGGKMLYYQYTLKNHEDFMENGEQKWETYFMTAQSGGSFYLQLGDDMVLTVGKTYTIGVKAVTECGESVPGWFTFEVSEAENAPDPIKNPKVYAANGTITVTWDDPGYWGENKYVPVTYGKCYKIWFYNEKDLTSESIYLDDDLDWSKSGLKNDVTYKIEIETVTMNRSHSTTLYATPTETVTTPSRPRSFNVRMDYKTASLSWKEPSFDGGAPLAYKVSKDGGQTYTDVGTATEYTFENLTTNMEYDFRVCAVNSAGTGDSAICVKTAPSSLSQLTINSIYIGYEQLELDFQPSADEILGYEVKLDDGEWQKITPILFDNTLHHIFTGLENDRAYRIYLRAYDAEGGGPEIMRERTPNSAAPRPVKNAAVKPRNGGIQFYGETDDPNVFMKYKVDNGKYWWTFSSGTRLNGFENGKNYTVGISTFGDYIGASQMRSTLYLTVTPDGSIPDSPSTPRVDAFVGEDYIRLTWTVESDGGAEIESYEIEYGENSDFVSLPGTENTFVFRVPITERENYRYFAVKAINSAGSATGGISVNPHMKLSGPARLLLPEIHEKTQSPAFALSVTYSYLDENDNLITQVADISEDAVWSFTSDVPEITWDENARALIVDKSLDAGTYEVTVNAKYNDVTFERTVKITVGATAQIVSVAKASGGLSVKLQLSESVGVVSLCAALYNADGRLTTTKLMEISADSLTNGEILIPIATSGSRAKVFLFDSMSSAVPLCEAVDISLK